MNVNKQNTEKYIVTRNNIPVSNEEFTQEEAKKEYDRWTNILKKWPDGSILKIESVLRKDK